LLKGVSSLFFSRPVLFDVVWGVVYKALRVFGYFDELKKTSGRDVDWQQVTEQVTNKLLSSYYWSFV
jgi:hypothetical protein